MSNTFLDPETSRSVKRRWINEPSSERHRIFCSMKPNVTKEQCGRKRRYARSVANAVLKEENII
ncbi:MAG: hypothetical protein ACSLE1_08215, partial [Sphingobium sp.]